MVLDEDKGTIIDLDGNDEEDDGMNERLWDEVFGREQVADSDGGEAVEGHDVWGRHDT